jgi:hypothetical protein
MLMRNWRKSAGAAAFGAAMLVAACQPAARAASCDENDPAGPVSTARITLGEADFTGETRDELRSFVATGSLGKVTVAVIGASPPGIVRSVTVVPEIGNYSQDYGERLEGVDIRVALKRGDRHSVVSVSLGQVCARYFRDSFLY